MPAARVPHRSPLHDAGGERARDGRGPHADGGDRVRVDTRSKIVACDAAPAGCTVAIGYFDVLLAAHARELAALSRPLLVIVLPREGELLAQHARAELVAGLRMVDYVVISPHATVDPLCDRLRPAQIVHLEDAHIRRTRELMEHVRNRQSR